MTVRMRHVEGGMGRVDRQVYLLMRMHRIENDHEIKESVRVKGNYFPHHLRHLLRGLSPYLFYDEATILFPGRVCGKEINDRCEEAIPWDAAIVEGFARFATRACGERTRDQ